MIPGQNMEKPGWDGPPEEENESVSLFRYVNVLLKRRWLIILGTLGLCTLAIVYAKLQTPVFEATASFLPSRAQGMSSKIDESFGVGRATNPAADAQFLIEYYSQILQSRGFLDTASSKPLPAPAGEKPLTLMESLKIKGETEAERKAIGLEAIRKKLKVVAPRAVSGRAASTVMSLSFSDSDPVIAAAAANLLLDELVLFSQNELNSKAKTNREFIENQLKETKTLLNQAETASSVFEKRNRKIATPELQIEQDRLKRNVRLQEEIYITLNKQLELAKIQEQETKDPIVVIQRAVPPRSRVSPQVRKTALIAGFLGLFLFCGIALVQDFLKRMNVEDPDMKEFLDTLQDVKGDAAKAGHILFGRKKKSKPSGSAPPVK